MKAVINKAFTWVDKKHLSPKKKNKGFVEATNYFIHLFFYK